ncbi:helix-turn-helix domain-containing protein [Cytobacillus firmus]|uniref:helix-turn-helix domain-containing protein n=1 Tax=Cytobacillus firmus TaxID=1399 RepID=UPI00300183C8
MKTIIVVKEHSTMPPRVQQIGNEVLLLKEAAFENINSYVQENKPDLVIFINFDTTIPKDWDQRLPKNTNYILFQNINNLELPQIILYLTSITNSFSSTILLRDTLISDSITYILKNLNNPNLTIDHVSSEFSLAPRMYSKRFKEYTSIYFKEFLIKARMIQAKKLLIQNLPVTTVCLDTGYEDLTHFSRMFKKTYGITPSKYKKSKKQTTTLPKAEY